jgi:hypothetical protein
MAQKRQLPTQRPLLSTTDLIDREFSNRQAPRRGELHPSVPASPVVLDLPPKKAHVSELIYSFIKAPNSHWIKKHNKG